MAVAPTKPFSWKPVTFGEAEKRLMIGFYCVRKLLDAHKLTTKIKDSNIHVESYLSTGAPVTRLNSHRIEKLYRIDRAQKETLSLRTICDQMVHSYVFQLAFGDNDEPRGVLITSDRTRNTKLYFVELKTIIAVFRAISKDEIVKAVLQLSERDYKLVAAD